MSRFDPRALTSRRIVLSWITIPIVLLLLGSSNAAAEFSYSNGEDLRADLTAVLILEQKLLEDLGTSPTGDPGLPSRLQKAIQDVQSMSYEHLELLRESGVSLVALRESLSGLDYLINYEATGNYDVTGQRKVMSGPALIPTLPNDCPMDDFNVGDGDPVVLPPGPCGQADLTDVVYPVVCPFSTPAGVILGARLVKVSVDFVVRSVDRTCKQVYVAAGFGGNASLACIVIDLIWTAIKEIFESLAWCNDRRGAAEGTTTYERTGEIFVKAREDTVTITTKVEDEAQAGRDAVTAVQTVVDENSRKIDKTILALAEVLRTLRIDNARLLDLVEDDLGSQPGGTVTPGQTVPDSGTIIVPIQPVTLRQPRSGHRNPDQ